MPVSTDRLASVVIANYNYGRFLRACIDSVLAQTYPHIEIIVVDDGSTDDSRNVIAGYGDRVRAVFQPNQGQAVALASGVAAATGDIICLLDSDDAWLPTKVQRVVDAFAAHPRAEWLRHKLAFVDEAGDPLSGVVPAFTGSAAIPPDTVLLAERIVTAPTSAIAFRRTAAARVFPLPDSRNFRLDADAILLAQLFKHARPGYSLDETLGAYRRHKDQTYTGRDDLTRLLKRQLEVDHALCEIVGRAPSSSACKQRVILAALAGHAAWHPARAVAFADGLRAAAALLNRPQLLARQLAGLVLAYAAPTLWIRRLERAQRLG